MQVRAKSQASDLFKRKSIYNAQQNRILSPIIDAPKTPISTSQIAQGSQMTPLASVPTENRIRPEVNAHLLPNLTSHTLWGQNVKRIKREGGGVSGWQQVLGHLLGEKSLLALHEDWPPLQVSLFHSQCPPALHSALTRKLL